MYELNFVFIALLIVIIAIRLPCNFKTIHMKTIVRISKNGSYTVAKKRLFGLFIFILGIPLSYAQSLPKPILDSVKQVVSNPMQKEISNDFTHHFNWKSKNDLRNDSIKIVALSPLSRRVKLVNGMALGVGYFENQRIKFQKVNGLNLEASPLTVALFTTSLNVPFESIFVGINDNSVSNAAFLYDVTPTYIEINGLNISTGGFMGGAQMNGLNVCVFSGMNTMNGMSITGVVLATHTFNGLCIAGIANMTDKGNGVQIALSNVSRTHHGIQIGLFNNSKNLRGLQLGLWNTNGKRRLPLINWQFKK
jgi:hypothetical protein